MTLSKRLGLGIALGLCLSFSCTASAPPDGDGDSDKTSGDGDGDIIHLGDGDGDGDLDITTQPPTVNCGDGIRTDDEACDDNNLEGGDGCGANCRFVEPGYVCPTPGEPCKPFAKCGDGIVIFPEQCDDGGLAPGDGCSATCKVEIGFKCDGSPSVCGPTTCGDGKQEGAETCDDNNTMPLDGCSSTCQAEPKCTDKGCTSDCGDGLIIGAEECDDGNLLDGDGCSSTCKLEPGYECSQEEDCTEIAGVCTLTLPIIVRDFSSAHSDFGVGCGETIRGITHPTLNAAGKPTLLSGAGACINSATSFAEWYTDAASNAEILETIVLFENESGAFVNRMDNLGTRYQLPPPGDGLAWCSNEPDGCAACAPGYAECFAPCVPHWGNDSTQTCARYDSSDGPIYMDGNPLFFPIDTNPLALAQKDSVKAKIPEEVYGGGWKDDPSSAVRNFHFTSETTYWFQYNAGDTPYLTFVGDDDVWVFVNRRLAVDLGGLHVPIEGSFAIAANGDITMTHGLEGGQPVTTTSDVEGFGMVDGGVYEIKVFQAERKQTGSSFKLTLSGFNASRSECKAICGDGILAAGEQCDNGEEFNVGGHNGCNSDCTLGAYCGDGIVQPEAEDCDDNDPNRPSGCFGCRVLVVR